jgi:hypothetical protein
MSALIAQRSPQIVQARRLPPHGSTARRAASSGVEKSALASSAIAQDHFAGTADLGIDKTQAAALIELPEQGFAAAEQDRMNNQA